MNRAARREFNHESLLLWLATSGHANPTGNPRHADEYHGRSGKPGARVNQDDLWLEAISQPDAVATDQFFTRALAFLGGLAPELGRALVDYASDPASIERLRSANGSPNGSPNATAALAWRIQVHENAIDAVLYLADLERRLLYWPSPDAARDYVARNVQKRRKAVYHYYQHIAAGDAVTVAVRKATRAAKCSERSVWKWIRAELRDLRAAHHRELARSPARA